MSKYTLLTNLQFIQPQGTSHHQRMNCNAILITQDPDEKLFGPHYTLRGFGTDAAWETFQMWFTKEQLEGWRIEGGAASANHVMLSDDRKKKARPIFSGSMLILPDGSKFFSQASDDARALDIHESPDGDISKVWDVLTDKTIDYWHAPNMPVIGYMPPALARAVRRRYV